MKHYYSIKYYQKASKQKQIHTKKKNSIRKQKEERRNLKAAALINFSRIYAERAAEIQAVKASVITAWFKNLASCIEKEFSHWPTEERQQPIRSKEKTPSTPLHKSYQQSRRVAEERGERQTSFCLPSPWTHSPPFLPLPSLLTHTA